MLKKIDGYKSIIGIIGLGIIHLFDQQGWLDPNLISIAYNLVGTWTGVSITLKANKAIKAMAMAKV